MKRVEWHIVTPNNDSVVKCDSFREAMDKYFEGYNVPLLFIDGIQEHFSLSYERVKLYYKKGE